ncbi:MAG: hypothetical protein HC775_11450 [Hyellaceae cyanobacterium CSU_1_1]|nr:hypothetical protein [Hyellaceae cyanobacterium CSU_1_1]
MARILSTVSSGPSSLSTLSGIFDENYQSAFGEFSHIVEGRKYCFQVQSELAQDLGHGDRLQILGKTYQIVGKQPKFDGKLSELILKQL